MKKEFVLTIVIYLFLSVTILFCKKDFNIDEIFSYGLANSQNGFAINFEWNQKYDDPESVFLNYMTVSEGHRFDYRNVWANQAIDVHPPLYYALLHTLCSFFPGKFSIWLAASINIIFCLLTVYIVYRIFHEIFSIENRLFLFFAFIGLAGCELHLMTFLRMYIMLIFECTLAAYLILKHIKEKFRKRDFAAMGILTVLGALTHYYFIVFIIIACIVFCIIMLLQHRGKETAIFSLTEVLAGILSVAIFPAMIKQIFSGYRGTETIDKLKHLSLSDFGTRAVGYYNIINHEVFGGILLIVLALLIILHIVFRKKNVNSPSGEGAMSENSNVSVYAFLLITAIGFFLFVVKSAPYVADRYISPIFPLCYVLVLGLSFSEIQKINKEIVKKIVFIILPIIMLAGSLRYPNDYLYRGSEQFLNTIDQDYSELDAVMIIDEKWKAQAGFSEVRKYKSITFVNQNEIEDIKNVDAVKNKEFMLLVPDDDALKIAEEYFPDADFSSRIGGSGYTGTYCVTR